MAEFTIKIGDKPGGFYWDGDIVTPWNDRAIAACHAGRLCHQKHETMTHDGLRQNSGICRAFFDRAATYMYERINQTEWRRTHVPTNDEIVIGPTPNAQGLYSNVQAYVDHAVNHQRHHVFGELGAEIIHIGPWRLTSKIVGEIWDDIEGKTAYRRTNFTRAPTGVLTTKLMLVIAVDDFTDDTLEELRAPVFDPVAVTPDGNPVMVQKRGYKVDWRNLPGLSIGTQMEVLDEKKDVDIREAVTFQRSQIVVEKVI